MAKTKAPSQPSLEDERTLESIVSGDREYASIRGRKMGFRDLTGFGLHKISQVMVREEENESSVGCKCVAAARLNGYFKIKLLWPILWRWYFYIRQYTDIELAEAVALIKKKAEVALAIYSVNTTLLTAIRETAMRMNRQEARATLQELSGDKVGR